MPECFEVHGKQVHLMTKWQMVCFVFAASTFCLVLNLFCALLFFSLSFALLSLGPDEAPSLAAGAKSGSPAGLS